MSTDERPDPAEMSFSDAIAELEDIVSELESDTLDVDHLADRVERAARLVERCRDRIDGARFSVEQILDRLDGDQSGTGTTDDPEP